MINRSKRFWNDYKNKHKGFGGSLYSGIMKAPLPSHEEMDDLEEYDIIFDIDPQIRQMVIALNKRGFRTLGSCAGHHNSRDGRGFIVLKTDYYKIDPAKKEQLLNILRQHGAKNIRLTPFSEKESSATFSPLGILKTNEIRRSFINFANRHKNDPNPVWNRRISEKKHRELKKEQEEIMKGERK